MKPEVRKIVAWHPVLTDHQAYTYQELSRQSGLPVIVQVSKLEDEVRRAQGWCDTRVTSIERQLIPARSYLRYGLRFLIENRNQVHFFGSAFENPRMLLLLWFATLLRLDCFIISEPYSQVAFAYLNDRASWIDRFKVWFRPSLYRGYVLALRGGLSGVFAISRLAGQQFADAGISVDKIFHFGYFVPREVLKPRHADALPVVRLVFVGSLIRRKGLETLVSAARIAIARGANLQLDVYGPGDPSTYGFDSDRIRFLGRIPFGSTQHRLLEYDLLVLPSYYDGWGVVVNEALCSNVPVLCSDQVGAQVLVETFGAGQVFPSGGEQALSELLFSLARDPARLKAMKFACTLAADAIQPSRAAAYMLEVLSADPAARRLIPSPWYRTPA